MLIVILLIIGYVLVKMLAAMKASNELRAQAMADMREALQQAEWDRESREFREEWAKKRDAALATLTPEEREKHARLERIEGGELIPAHRPSKSSVQQ